MKTEKGGIKGKKYAWWAAVGGGKKKKQRGEGYFR